MPARRTSWITLSTSQGKLDCSNDLLTSSRVDVVTVVEKISIDRERYLMITNFEAGFRLKWIEEQTGDGMMEGRSWHSLYIEIQAVENVPVENTADVWTETLTRLASSDSQQARSSSLISASQEARRLWVSSRAVAWSFLLYCLIRSSSNTRKFS